LYTKKAFSFNSRGAKEGGELLLILVIWMDEDFCWEEVVQAGEDPDFGLDVTGIDSSNDAVQIKPVYPMKMKFDGFEMSEFFQFYIVFSFF
jgi:hypothetical protein